MIIYSDIVKELREKGDPTSGAAADIIEQLERKAHDYHHRWQFLLMQYEPEKAGALADAAMATDEI